MTGNNFYGANTEGNSRNISPAKQGSSPRKSSIKEVKIFPSEEGYSNNMTKGSFKAPPLSENIRHMHADSTGNISGSATKNIHPMHNHGMHA
jgi:carbonic anhydrase